MSRFKTVFKNGYNLMVVLLLLVVFSPKAFSQKNIRLKVEDLKTNSPLEGVTVSISQNRILAIGKTNLNGEYSVDLKANGKLTIMCSMPNYETFERSFEVNGDTISFEVKLRPDVVQEFKEIIVKAPGAVDTVFGSGRLSVEDFEVLNNGDLLLLTYSKRLSKGSEIALYNGQQVLNTFPVPGRADHLEKDYRGNVHVICKDRVFTILPNGNNLQIAQLDKDYYFRYIAPILDTNGREMYFSDFNKNYPEFSFWKYDQIDSTYDIFRTIRDDLMMELYRSEYKWVDVRTKLWAKSLEYETGIDAEIWVGANFFTQSVYYKELYAPFFKVKDQLKVFDYYSEKMFTHNMDGLVIDSVDINHHLNYKTTGWKKHLLQDKVTGNIYAWFEKAGTSYLGLIDLKTGEILEKYQLNFKYLDKIEVHNNFVYYVYRPFESPQKKFLYKEKLPLNFTNSN